MIIKNGSKNWNQSWPNWPPNNITEPRRIPWQFLNYITMKKVIEYFVEMNRVDPEAIPLSIGVSVLFYFLLWVLPTIVQ